MRRKFAELDKCLVSEHRLFSSACTLVRHFSLLLELELGLGKPSSSTSTSTFYALEHPQLSISVLLRILPGQKQKLRLTHKIRNLNLKLELDDYLFANDKREMLLGDFGRKILCTKRYRDQTTLPKCPDSLAPVGDHS